MKVEDLIRELYDNIIVEYNRFKLKEDNPLHMRVIEDAHNGYQINQHSYNVFSCFINYFYHSLDKIEGKPKYEKIGTLYELVDEFTYNLGVPIDFDGLMEWASSGFARYVDDILSNISDYEEITSLYDLLDTAYTKFTKDIGKELVYSLINNTEMKE